MGLDISTSVVGVVLLETTHPYKLVKKFAIKLNKTSLEEFWEKVDYVQSVLIQEVSPEEYSVKKIFVEENAMAFSVGFSSAGTLFTLAKFNGIVSNDARRIYSCVPQMINVRSARKILSIKIDTKDKTKDTKTKIFEIVRTINPDFDWEMRRCSSGKNKGKIIYDKSNYDVADAWVIVAGGILLENRPRPNEQKTKGKKK